VTQELADLRQRRPSPQHLYRGRVSQPMRMDSPETGPLGGIGHHAAHAARTEVTMRSFDSDKYHPPPGADRTATLEILGHGAANIRGQWNAFDRVRLAANDDFAGSPVDIVQPKLSYFARPHTETD
jgi:hypothetical protein